MYDLGIIFLTSVKTTTTFLIEGILPSRHTLSLCVNGMIQIQKIFVNNLCYNSSK